MTTVGTEVKRLKEKDGRGLVLYGQGPLGAELLERGLLDELQFAVHPRPADHRTVHTAFR